MMSSAPVLFPIVFVVAGIIAYVAHKKKVEMGRLSLIKKSHI